MDLQEYYQGRRDVIDRKLAEYLSHLDVEIDLLAGATVAGRRFRAVAAVLACEAFGGEVEDCIEYACAVELTHKASVLRDDLADHDSVRDGEPSFHISHGARRTMATSDVLWAGSMNILTSHSRVPADLMKELATAQHEMALGQFTDLAEPTTSHFDDPHAALETAQHASLRKTGALIGAALAGGTMCATARTPGDVDGMREAGRQLGALFQLLNDYDNLINSTAHVSRRSEVSTDIRERRLSAAFWIAYLLLDKSEQERVARLVLESERPSDEHVEEISRILNSARLPEAISSLSNQYQTRARSAMLQLRVTQYRDILLDLAASLNSIG